MNRIHRFVVVSLMCVVTACFQVTLVDVSFNPRYKHLVGERYEIIGAVDAYGIRRHSKAEVEYITLIPPPGIGGWEVGFRERLDHGTVINITKVMKTGRWVDCGIAFIVEQEGASLPVAATTRVELSRGNNGRNCLTLNPEIYKKV